MSSSSAIIGAAVGRIEGPQKTTGHTKYAGDVGPPGMLWGGVLRSPHPHARIVSIDPSEALRVPGVVAVVTGKDTPGLYQGKILRDIPVLCWDRVRYVGDRVAAVAAESREAVEEALRLIAVHYEPLPAVFDPIESMNPEAPVIHEDPTGYLGFPMQRAAEGIHNGQSRLHWSKGDVEQGFRDADLVMEHSFRIPSRHQGYLEPYASVLRIDDDGRVQVWCSSKSPFRTREQLSKAMGIPEESIKVNVVAVGGDFGGKGDARDLPIAYLLARKTGRPIKIIMSFAEELTASNPSHPTVITVKSGVMRDGTLVARKLRAIHASGAYGGMKPNAALSTWHYVGGGYRITHSDFEFLQIYTNTVPGGYFRAPGAHQYAFAVECHTNILAQELGIDPVKFRMNNFVHSGEEDAIGRRLEAISAQDVLQAAVERAEMSPLSRGVGYGRGVALFGRQIGGGAAGAVLTAEADGSFALVSPTVDVGTGTHTIEQQMVASEMGIDLNRVTVRSGDTDSTPFDEGPRASRVTYTEGQAVLEACRRLKSMLADGASLPLTVTVEHEASQSEDVMYFCAQVAEVFVDTETGQVRVLRVISAHDVGTVINPLGHQGQINGGFITGFGLAMTEEFVSEDGRVLNGSLADYKLPNIQDVPQLETVLVPTKGGLGPYEAKAIGELANNSTAAAIANAIADATGVRMFELPLTAEKVYRQLHSQETRD